MATMMATVLVRGNRAAAAKASVTRLEGISLMQPIVQRRSAMFLLGSKAPSPQQQLSNCILLPHINIKHRCIMSSTAVTLHNDHDEKISTAMLHSLYHEQMKEIQNEREAVFGSDVSDESSNSPDLSQTAKSYFQSIESSSQPPLPSSSSCTTTTSLPGNSSAPQFLPPGWNAEEAYAERESLFAFTEEEQHAWNNRGVGNSQTVAAHNNRMLHQLSREPQMNQENDTETEANDDSSPSSPLFSHLTPRGDGVTMVDVGHKASTRRVALARSVVIFPPEVLSALQLSHSEGKSEMIGPKGPIFETAKIAGILGAK